MPVLIRVRHLTVAAAALAAVSAGCGKKESPKLSNRPVDLGIDQAKRRCIEDIVDRPDAQARTYAGAELISRLSAVADNLEMRDPTKLTFAPLVGPRAPLRVLAITGNAAGTPFSLIVHRAQTSVIRRYVRCAGYARVADGLWVLRRAKESRSTVWLSVSRSVLVTADNRGTVDAVLGAAEGP